MPRALHSDRLILRPWRKADLDPLFAINGDPGSMRHFPAVMTRAESDAWAARLQAHIEDHGWGFWAVEERGGAPFIGESVRLEQRGELRDAARVLGEALRAAPRGS